MLRACRSALHRTREELIDPRLSRRRFQRLLHFGCWAHVDTPLAQLLLGNGIRALVRATWMRVAQAEQRGTALRRRQCVNTNKTNNLLENRPEVLEKHASHQRVIVHGVVRLGSSDLPVVPDRTPSLLELLHLRSLYSVAIQHV
jgi:hypothetical protein